MSLSRRTTLAAAAQPRRSRAQTRPPIKLGILADMTGTYRDLGGPLVEPCVRQAIQDSGIEARGIAVEVVVADHLNKVDAGLAIAGEWRDRAGVDAPVDISNSALVALAPVVRDKDKAPAIVSTTSSTCHLSPAAGSLRRIWFAKP